MCDWLKDFESKLGYPEIQRLKADKFHGSIEIHFCSGEPLNYNLKLHRKAVSTLTKGANHD